MKRHSACHLDSKNSLADIGQPERIWSLSAIHGDVERLISLHDKIYDHIKPGDRVLYTGNYMGYGLDSARVIDELLTFRRLLLSKQGIVPSDIIYLRGAQEDMFQKLLSLPFTNNPQDVLLWMLGNGLTNTLYSYGLSPHDGIEACRQGVMSLTKWTNQVRSAIRKNRGHEIFGTQLKRAAYTKKSHLYPMLFVHTGIDIRKPLTEQGDNFWWAHEKFENINIAYKPFAKVVRGFDPSHRGVHMNCVTATIDGGCGFGGNLVCAGFEQDGSVAEIIEA